MTRSLQLIAAGILAFLSACRGQQQPADPVWGKQPCAHCHMLLSDPTHAAQLLVASGQPQYFDDIGCLIEATLDRPKAAGTAWVRDATGTWHEAERARYGSGHRTPMGYGIGLEHAGPLDFAQVQREIAAKRAARTGR